MDQDIKSLCRRICSKYKKDEKKINKELEKLKKFLCTGDLYRGNKRKIKSIINSFKKINK